MKKNTTSKENPGKKPAARQAPKAVSPKVRLRVAAPQPIQVKHLAQLPKYVRPRRIHPRRTLPFVREGVEREFHSMTRQVALHRALSVQAPMAATDELVLVTNTELTAPTTQQRASNVGEPSAAIKDQVVFYTGNWFAAMSSDGGKSFNFVDPATAFSNADPPSSNFCCDQVVQYIEQIDTFVWLMQYGPETGDNIQRLAFASTSDVVQGRWRLFDITTQILNVGGAFMDFPDLAVGANSLYVTTNIFATGNQVGSAVIRIPLSEIKSGEVTAEPFVSMDLQSLRVAQNCGTTAFFAAHKDTSTLSVFSWDEAKSVPVSQAVGVARWIGGNGYQSRTPDGRRWLDRADPRITGATLASNELWFAWSVDRGSNQRPKPFVQIARIDSSNLTLVENLNIFDADSAICYAALGTNANNEVGASYMIGGGTRFPSHVVGILTGTRKDVVVAAGDRGPLDPQTGKGEWGDYLTVRRVFPDQNLFAATGYTMKGSGDGSNQDATPRFVVFGRASDTGTSAVVAGGGTSAAGTGDTGAGVVSGPISDVNSLPVVSASEAAQIKASAMAQGVAPEVARAMHVEVPPTQLQFVTKPGVERWPVKTGTDADVAKVGKNEVNGQFLGAGIVAATVEELIRIPRSADMMPPTSEFPEFQQKRKNPVETTIWQIEADIIALKQETDGDYHLVLQGTSGQTMVAEIPTPRAPFVLAASPWLANIKAARQAVDDKLVSKLSPADFVPLDDMLVPRKSLSSQPEAVHSVPASFRTSEGDERQAMPAFKTRVPPTPARITGVGFFDKVHGQMGVALLNGIELHPVLKIEWL
jgi:hypothetical protein